MQQRRSIFDSLPLPLKPIFLLWHFRCNWLLPWRINFRFRRKNYRSRFCIPAANYDRSSPYDDPHRDEFRPHLRCRLGFPHLGDRKQLPAYGADEESQSVVARIRSESLQGDGARRRGNGRKRRERRRGWRERGRRFFGRGWSED